MDTQQEVNQAMTALAAALSGEGPAVRFGSTEVSAIEVPEGIAVVIGTSGSTGRSKQVLLSVDALAASSMATALRLRGEGQWLLALPLHYVAGVQVLIRSLYAGTKPQIVEGKFSVTGFCVAAAEMTDPIRFTSLVPTQLNRLLDAPEALPTLRRFNAILLGGAPASEELLSRSREAGLSIVTTYGSAETCGGCIYDGEPLEGVEVALRADEKGNQLIWLGGAVIADGYLSEPELDTNVFQQINGTRWYQTSDIGEFDEQNRLRVLGRADDVLITGGLKVSAEAIATKLRSIDGVRDAFVSAVPSAEWGQKVAAAIVTELSEQQLRNALDAVLERHAVPKSLVILPELPLLAQGKVDRQRLLVLLQHQDRGE
ncbi:AMP-binding protein [Psychromicrobium lacuslunae]|uniref:AMP-dependent synthetase n=1 Tax=Psychromicrobium lacuslunae TaxID=1618207 RepID=A0A0D4C008_9MICC|nr:AMP-binding protein [Psychromicrobium lacuslunae]AJT41918.1 AMP-dependent synthetase [Psychromicrobium lacuslunae]